MVEDHRLTTLLLTAIVLLLSSSGLSNLQITSDNRSFFGTNDPHFQDLTEFEAEFAPYSTAVFLVTGKNPIAESSTHQQAHIFLTSAARKLPYAYRIDSLATFPVVSSIGDEITIDSLLDENCSGKSCLVRADVLDRPALQNRLISSNKTTSAVIASFRLDVGESHQVQEVMNSISNKMRKEFQERFPDLQLHITGGVPMMQAFVTATEKDLGTLIPIAGLLLLVVLVFVLGSIFLASAMIILGSCASVIALGVAGWFGLVLNSATSSIPIVIFALTIATTMHLFLHVARGYAVHGATSFAIAFRSALSIYSIPILMTIGTTIVGMMSLTSVPSPPVRDLGIWVSVGLLAGGTLTFTALPAALSFRKSIPESKFALNMQKYFNSYARSIESGHSLLLMFILGSSLAIGGIGHLRIDDDFVSYFDDSSEFRVDTDFATEELAGPYGVEIVVSTTDGNDIFSPHFFGYLSALGERLAADPRVRNSLSIYEILDAAKSDFQSTDVPLERESNQYLAQLFLTYEFSLLKDQSTSDFVDISHSSTRVSVLLNRATSTEIRKFVRDIQDWHDSNSQPGVGLTITGESVPTAFLSPSNIKAMMVGIFISLVISAGVIGLYYRSIKIGFTAILSILIPVLMGFGAWGWIYGSIGLATTVVVAITIGVVIDDSIHMIVRAMDGHRNLELNGEKAAAYSVYRVGVAIVGTTIVLVAAFSVLLASGFELNSAFGACTALILLSALAFDLIALPKMLTWITHSEAVT